MDLEHCLHTMIHKVLVQFLEDHGSLASMLFSVSTEENGGDNPEALLALFFIIGDSLHGLQAIIDELSVAVHGHRF